MAELVDDNVVRRQPPRELSLIFDELRSLMQVEGALHEISAIVYRDWLLVIDTKEARVVDPPEQRWSSTKLNNNELLLLLGLMVQSVDDRIYSVFMTSNEFAKKVDDLLREFHDALLNGVFGDEVSIGRVAREAIYYGADSFYLHQLSKFSRIRYRDDATWLLSVVRTFGPDGCLI